MPTLYANRGASVGPTAPSPGLEVEVAAVVRPPSPEAYWRKPITEYLRLGTILDNEIETQRLTHRAKGYMIHDDELYQRNTSDII
jgi:hypothetical protein